jgi:hypothetical protein
MPNLKNNLSPRTEQKEIRMSPRTSERRNCRLKGGKQSYAPTASANIPSIHEPQPALNFLPVEQWVLNK